MIKSVFNWLFITLSGALMGALFGVFAVGFFWYFFPRYSIIELAESDPGIINRLSVIVFIACIVLGMCWMIVYVVRDNKE